MKQILTSLIVVLITATATLLGQSQLEKAKELLDQKKSAEAIAVCQSFLQSSPRNEEGWLLLAKAQQQAGDLNAAEKAAKKSVELDDELIEGYTVLAEIQLAKKDWLTAYTTAQTGLGQTPRGEQKSPRLLISLAWSLLAIDSVDAAIVSASQARELEPNNPTSYNIIGSAYLMQKQAMVMAITNFVKCLEINPAQIEVLFKLADAYSKNRQYTEAAKSYNKLLELDPNNCNARLELARLLYRAKQYSKSVKVFEEYFAKCKSISKKEERKIYIEALLKCNQFEKALEEVQDIIKEEPNSPLVHRIYANWYFNKKQYPKAIESFNKLKNVDTLDTDEYRLLGFAYTYTKQDVLAAAAWEEIVKDTSESITTRSLILENIGGAWMRLEMYDKAMDAYERRLKLDPTSIAAMINKAICLEQMKKWPDAINLLKEANQKNPNYPPIHANLGYCYFQIKSYDESRKEYDKTINLVDTAVYKYRYEIADANRMIGLIIMLKKETDPELSKKKWEDALVYLKRSLKNVENVGQTHFLMGKCYQNLNKIKEAVQSYKRACKLDPTNAEACKLSKDLEKFL